MIFGQNGQKKGLILDFSSKNPGVFRYIPGVKLPKYTYTLIRIHFNTVAFPPQGYNKCNYRTTLKGVSVIESNIKGFILIVNSKPFLHLADAILILAFFILRG